MELKTYSQNFLLSWWLWIGLFLSSIIFGRIFFAAMVRGESLFWILYLSIIAVIVIAVFMFFLCAKLQIKILGSHLNYRFFPFHMKWRTIPFDCIAEITLIKYDALGDFGGWGLRKGKSGEKALIITGEFGIKLKLKSGETLVFGVHNKVTAASLLSKIKPQ